MNKIKELIRKYEQERDKLKQLSIATHIKDEVEKWVKELARNYR